MNKFVQQARRVLKLINRGLPDGIGDGAPRSRDTEGMCVMAVVSYVFDEDGTSDSPTCVDRAVANFNILLNDADWYPEERLNRVTAEMVRARSLRRVAIAQLGSRNGNFDVKAWKRWIRWYVIRRILPKVYRAAGNVSAAVLCESFTRRNNASIEGRQALVAALAQTMDDEHYDTFTYVVTDSFPSSYEPGDLCEAWTCLAPNISSNTLLAMLAEASVSALRKAKSPGVKVMSQVFPRRRKPPVKQPVSLEKPVKKLHKKPLVQAQPQRLAMLATGGVTLV